MRIKIKGGLFGAACKLSHLVTEFKLKSIPVRLCAGNGLIALEANTLREHMAFFLEGEVIEPGSFVCNSDNLLAPLPCEIVQNGNEFTITNSFCTKHFRAIADNEVIFREFHACEMVEVPEDFMKRVKGIYNCIGKASEMHRGLRFDKSRIVSVNDGRCIHVHDSMAFVEAFVLPTFTFMKLEAPLQIGFRNGYAALAGNDWIYEQNTGYPYALESDMWKWYDIDFEYFTEVPTELFDFMRKHKKENVQIVIYEDGIKCNTDTGSEFFKFSSCIDYCGARSTIYMDCSSLAKFNPSGTVTMGLSKDLESLLFEDENNKCVYYITR